MYVAVGCSCPCAPAEKLAAAIGHAIRSKLLQPGGAQHPLDTVESLLGGHAMLQLGTGSNRGYAPRWQGLFRFNGMPC